MLQHASTFLSLFHCTAGMLLLLSGRALEEMRTKDDDPESGEEVCFSWLLHGQ